ncbi:MAG TPA: pyruvate dehydrogenase complex dihydrolipoamide acetyltransferase [Pyrinomonadaceae bacterium]|jgi:pyruvate dehydrogenase E2 component (dihydrolipoamide acetyltransferase)|nr:pyruvate dehydrogenase complex dihydrolipoamide acetyltransferase [Pyrinomonadaceae bacterium]
MATQVVMPKLSPTMEEGQLSRWLKKEGDKVSMGEPIAEIDTDKATMEMQALGTGVLRKILIAAGETAPLGQLIAIIGEPDEDISALVNEAGSSEAAAENKQRIETSVEAGQDGAQQETAQVAPSGARTQATIEGQPLKGDVGGRPDDGAQQQQQEAAPAKASGASAPSGNGAQAASESGRGQQQTGERLVVSPIAARMAAEAGINLRSLSGSGPGGRIVKRDIEAAISAGQQPAAQATEARADEAAQQPRHLRAVESSAQPSTQPAPQPQPSTTGAPPFHDEPSSAMRQTIARRLVTSIGPVPHFFLTTEIEMDRAAEMRRNINELDQELKASVNDIIIKVTAHALMQHPQVNASFQEKSVRYYERADIGVAVAIEDGLITPVIRSANTKAIGAIAREVRELAERARAKKLHPDEYTGATFSISNLGMMGIDEFTAVINPPEAAILAIGAMTPKPVVRDGEIVVRQMMRVTMSCDHRVIDGATGARFLQTFKKILENPLYLIA